MKSIMKRALALALALVFVLATAESSVVYAAPKHHKETHSHSSHSVSNKHAHVFNRAVTEKWTDATCENYATQTWACSKYVTKNGKKVLCSEEVTIVTGKKLAHKYVSTATEESEGVYQCACGAVEYVACKGCKEYRLFFLHIPHAVVKVAPKLPHTHVEVEDAAVDATCDTPGLTAGSHCGTCGEVLVAQEVIEAEGHAWTTVGAKAPTCTEAGHNEYQLCADCGQTADYVEIPTSGHEWLEIYREGNCLDGFSVIYRCDVCTDRKEEFIASNEHTWATVGAKAPTCTEAGHNEYSLCTTCGIYWDYEEIPATGHNEVVVPGTEATCKKAGLTDGVICGTCGDVLVEQEEVFGDHAWYTRTHTGNCSDGYTLYNQCSVCKKVETVTGKGHAYATVAAKAPTCTEAGHYAYELCKICGYSTYPYNVIDATGHDLEMIVVVPAGTAHGTAYDECKSCGEKSDEYEYCGMEKDFGMECPGNCK